MVLGYTRHGRAVLRPTDDVSDDPIGDDQDEDWTRGDHKDAASILAEHSGREPDPTIALWCVHWARRHRAFYRRPTDPEGDEGN